MSRRKLIAAVLLIGAGLRAQDTVIRTETRVVLVDAVAVDKKNTFVNSLTQKDFRIWEDGKEQKIAGFSLESAGVAPERSNKHCIAMLFDTTTGGQTIQVAMKQEATRFVEGFATPDRYMAVLSYGAGLQIGQNFTADADRVKKAIASIQGSTLSNVGIARDAPAAAPGRGSAASPSTLAMQVDTSPYRNLLATLRGVAASLATIRGRKALVLFSGGANASSDLTTEIRATIDAFNKANVGIYAVAPQGTIGADTVPTTQPNQRITAASLAAATSQQVSSAQNLLADLAAGTGGLVFATLNDLARSLGRVAQEQDQYYLLGYTPTVDWPEGTCHELTVKVDRGDLEVRARKSYCTSKPVDLLAGKTAGKDLEARAANGSAGNLTATMQLPWFYTEPNVAQVDLAMDILPTAMRFQKDKGKLHGEFDLAGVAYQPDNSVAARFSDTVKLDFDTQQQADAFVKVPYHYVNQFPIGPGKYNFRVAFSSGAQGFGKVEMPLVVTPWSGDALSLSGLALSHETHPVADLSAGLDASLLEGQRPLTAKGSEAIPSGTSQFRAGAPGFVYFEVYEPLLKAPGPALPVVGVRTRILERATGAQKSDTGVKTIGSFMRQGNPTVPVISPLPIEGLPAGAYRLEVTAMRQTGTPVTQTVDFDVIR